MPLKIWLPSSGPLDDEESRLLIGEKASGLRLIPSAWTPSYFVLTTALYRDWANGDLESGWLSAAILGSEAAGECLSVCRAEHVLVRSSGTIERLDQRGRLQSQTSPSDIDQIEAAALECWDEARRCLAGTDAGAEVALIIQAHRSPRRTGHLSNERRVSERHDSWVVEQSDREGAFIEASRISPSYDVNPADALRCPYPQTIEGCLRSVASLELERGRRHFEWLWDGAHIWVVQCDFERTPKGRRPNSEWRTQAPPAITALECLVDATAATGDWQKTHCVRVFAEADLPTATLWVLEDPDLLSALGRGEVADALARDVQELARSPVVVRTDVSRSSPDRPGLLLPRTETCISPEEVTRFLQETAHALMTEHALRADEFCFLIHRFLPARSGTYSVAAPDRRRVRIDAIWGVPDGLLYLSHDSFEVAEDGSPTMRKIRCKSIYIDFKPDGSWFEKDAGTAWDWTPSVTPEELSIIGEQARAVAQTIGEPIEIMHFVGVHEDTRLPAVLPWFFRPTELTPDTSEFGPRFAGRSFLVRQPSDLEDLSALVQEGEKIPSIRVRATTEYVHSQTFVTALAEKAKELGLPVDLEGSVLGHSYYMLQRAGVRVRPIDAAVPPEVVGVQTFDKLVRDNIPQIIESSGEAALTRKASRPELLQLLREKAVEEALEVHGSVSDDDLLGEAADLLEVLRAVCFALDRSLDDLMAIADRKRASRGGFEEGVVLRGTYVRALTDAGSGERLFEIEQDPFVRGRGLLQSLGVLAGEEELRILVGPTASGIPERIEAEIPGSGLAVEITRDSTGLRLGIIRVQNRPHPDQGQLFDLD